MDAARSLQIQQQLAGLKGAELVHVASAALTQCEDAECRNGVLTNALNAAGSLMPTHVGEGTRIALGLGAGVLSGGLRGTFGDLWGRVASGVPALAGLTLGIFGGSASQKAAGYSVLLGSAAGAGAIEARDLGDVLRAKMMTPVTRQPTGTPPPAPPAK